MDQKEIDQGTIVTLLERMTEIRLPRARRLLKRVNEGALLTESDIDFLERAYSDNRQLGPLLARNPDYGKLVVAMDSLYVEIIRKGLNNESFEGGR